MQNPHDDESPVGPGTQSPCAATHQPAVSSSSDTAEEQVHGRAKRLPMASDSDHSMSHKHDSDSDGTSQLADRTSPMNTDPPASVLGAETDVVRKVESLSGCIPDRDRRIRRCVCLLCVMQSANVCAVFHPFITCAAASASMCLVCASVGNYGLHCDAVLYTMHSLHSQHSEAVQACYCKQHSYFWGMTIMWAHIAD